MVTPETKGRVAFAKLASDSVKNVIFFGIGTGVIMGVGSHVRWLGLLLFGIDALITLLQVAVNVFTAILAVFLILESTGFQPIRQPWVPQSAWSTVNARYSGRSTGPPDV